MSTLPPKFYPDMSTWVAPDCQFFNLPAMFEPAWGEPMLKALRWDFELWLYYRKPDSDF